MYNIPRYNTFAQCNKSYRTGGALCTVNDLTEYNQVSVNMIKADILLLNINTNELFFNLFCLYRLHECSKNKCLTELSDIGNSIKKNIIYIRDIIGKLMKRYLLSKSV